MAQARPKVALVLTGGGARAAYQVGVLRALAEIIPDGVSNPFPIICGTSAGAINAAALAADAADFRRAVRRLMYVWKNFQVSHVYRADPWGAFYNSARWVLGVATGGHMTRGPVSLLDNSPLAGLLRRHEAGTLELNFEGRAWVEREYLGADVAGALDRRLRTLLERQPRRKT